MHSFHRQKQCIRFIMVTGKPCKMGQRGELI